MSDYNSVQVAEQMGIPSQTVDAWAEEFCIPYDTLGKSRQFNDEALGILQSIKNLRDQDNGFNTIKHKLSFPQMQRPSKGEPHSSSQLQGLIEETLESKLSDMLDEKLSHFVDMSEKYAQANFELGQMSEQNKQAEDEIHRLKTQLKILPSPDEWMALCEREKMGQSLLFGLQEQIDGLHKELAELNGTQWPVSPELKELHEKPDEPEADIAEESEDLDLSDS